MGVRLAGTQQVDRRLWQVTCAIGTGNHQGTTTIGDQAAVTDAERTAHHLAVQYVGDAERSLAVREGNGIELGPGAGSNGHLGHLFAGCAVLVHVPGGGQGVARNRMARLVGCLVVRLLQWTG
ncbi:hypothetical protein D9M68_608340 [compost metagenome]